MKPISTLKSLITRRSSEIERFIVVFTAVTVGLSQILFNLILNNLEHFPNALSFFLFVILTIHVAPIICVYLFETALVKKISNNLGIRIWRVSLFLFIAISVLRQAHILMVEPIRSWLILLFKPYGIAAVCLALILVLALWYGYRVATHFVRYLFPLALALLVMFVIQSHMLNTGWTNSKSDELSNYSPPANIVAGSLPPVFIIMWDGLEYHEVIKDGSFDKELVPNLSSLAKDGAWLSNAQSLSSSTDVSIGQNFLRSTVIAKDSPLDNPTLFDYLASVYRLHIYEEKAVLARQLGCVHPAISCRGELYVSTHMPGKVIRWSFLQTVNLMVPKKVFTMIGYMPSTYEPQIDRIINDIKTSEDSSGFWYWHPILPHPPWVFNADGTKHNKLSQGNKEFRAQIQYVDLLLGKFINALKEEHLYDKSIVVVTSDHGSPNRRCPCVIPFIILGPNITIAISDIEYNHTDFLPTILDILNISIDDSDHIEGTSKASQLQQLHSEISSSN